MPVARVRESSLDARNIRFSHPVSPKRQRVWGFGELGALPAREALRSFNNQY
jgi:hypothetical protein